MRTYLIMMTSAMVLAFGINPIFASDNDFWKEEEKEQFERGDEITCDKAIEEVKTTYKDDAQKNSQVKREIKSAEKDPLKGFSSISQNAYQLKY